ncbi:Ppx/GppA phosphatase family protein [Antarcticirhabdus aurantiaca]|nr:Ppx/GppA phosphatase family protein [Antarcticirhabdus aurantiaca]
MPVAAGAQAEKRAAADKAASGKLAQGARQVRRRGGRRWGKPGDKQPAGERSRAPEGVAVSAAEPRARHPPARPAPPNQAPRRGDAPQRSPEPINGHTNGAALLPEGERPRPAAYAALDLGTNNCRLLVAVPTKPGQFRVIDAFSRIVRLGEGLGRTGRLSTIAMDRAIAALEICSHKLSARRIAASRLIATEACRAASNGEEFIERVRDRTGLQLEIVSRETEARLAVSGCGSLVDRSAKGAVLFDIGGGSTEIALLDLRSGFSRRLSNNIVAWTSLPVGVVNLAERYGGRNVTPELFKRMVDEVTILIASFGGRDKLEAIVGQPGFHLLGTSGTVTTLAGVHLGLERYDRRQVDGLWLTSSEADSLVATIAGWSFEERVANPCIGSDRADLVLAGCAILQAIRRVWPARALRVADRGLREGLLTEMMVADGVWRRGGNGADKGYGTNA